MSGSAIKVEKEIGGRMLSLEAGKIAKQADGAVVVRYADTVILATAQSAPARESTDFFPLTVDYREKLQAAGKIPGGRFYKREGRPTFKEILTMRMIDRPLRPLFPNNYREEVQIMAMVLSADAENDPDVLSMIGSAAALCISSIPFETPVGVVRVSRLNGEFILNPTVSQLVESDLELVVSAVGEDVVMIESSAKEVPEEVVLDAIRFARKHVAQVSDLIRQLAAICGKPKQAVPVDESFNTLAEFVRKNYSGKIDKALDAASKQVRGENTGAVRAEASAAAVEAKLAESVAAVYGAFDAVVSEVVRRRILAGKRSDGRTPKDLRPITCEIGVLPRTHGSALFTRGETQALATVTLGTALDEEMVESLGEDYTRKFMLHYNFPPFSGGEVKPVRGPSRRDIGHGALAEKAVECIAPVQEVFPYTIRIVSDIMESNGSSSMATVCGATLALMDAGVPIARPVAGVSIGLVKEGGQAVLLTDIQGEEDNYGDMDFKIAGTQTGVTAIQLDTKIPGLSDEIIAGALAQARDARMAILRQMLATIARPRPEISVYAPKLVKIKINPDKIGMVIGSGGKVVRKIQEESGATVELDDDGTVTISAPEKEAIEKAREAILAIVEEPEIGRTYDGTVRGIKDFGAFVEIIPGTEGLCHISELDEGYVSKVTDVVRMGDRIAVKVIGIDDSGKIRLSRKAALRDQKSHNPASGSAG